MLEDRLVYLNGEFVPWEKATVHQMSHSFARGSAIFEVMSLHDTIIGPAVFRLDEHTTRLFRSADLLDMEIPLSYEELQMAVIETVKRNEAKQGIIKVLGFYPQVALDVMPPQKMLEISVFVIDYALDLGGYKISHEGGTTVCISTWRKLDPQTVPVEAKAAANYLNGMVAKQEAVKRGFENAVMLDTQGFIAEGGTESFFMVKDNVLMVPSLGTVLKSISRKSILEAAGIIGLETFEGRVHPEIAIKADEAFLSASPFKVLPVKQFEDRMMEPVPGPVSQKLLDLMDNILAGNDSRFKDWLFAVDS